MQWDLPLLPSTTALSFIQASLQHYTRDYICKGKGKKPWTKGRITTLDLQNRACLAQEFLCRWPWETILERKAQESWRMFKNHLFQVKERSMATHRKASRGGRRHGSMKQELLTRHEKAAYKRWKQEQATWGDAPSKHAQVGSGKTKPKWSGIWKVEGKGKKN